TRAAPPLPSLSSFQQSRSPRDLPSFPTRRSSDLRSRRGGTSHSSRSASRASRRRRVDRPARAPGRPCPRRQARRPLRVPGREVRSEEHTSELQSLTNLVCRLLLEKKKNNYTTLLR